MTDFAEDPDLVQPFGRVRLLVHDERQRFLDRGGVALTDAQDQRRLAGRGHGFEQFVRQAREFASAVGFLEAFHEMDGVRGRRGETQELRADEQVGPTALRREATHEARQQMLLDQGALPD